MCSEMIQSSSLFGVETMHNGFNVTDDVTQFSFSEGTESKFLLW